MSGILVTGATGFVGRHVLRALEGTDVEVHAVSRSKPGESHGAVWHRADLLDVEDVRRLIRTVRPEGLIHLAWFATPPAYWRSPENLRWVAASLELVTAFAEEGGRRIVAIGTCAEYDWRYGYCVERLTPLTPRTLYGTAKAALAAMLERYAEETSLSLAWARLFHLYGPGEPRVRLVPSLVTALRQGQPARCTSGAHIRDFLHVADAARALVAVYRSPVTGPINIASGVPLAIATLATAIASQIQSVDLLQVETGGADDRMVVADVHRLREEVGWVPTVGLEEGLRDTIESWTAHLVGGNRS